jgi:hypothetical protein
MKATTPLLASSAGLIVGMVALEVVLPTSGFWWIALRVALPLLVFAVIRWSHLTFLRAGVLPRWWPDERPRG